MFLEVMLVLHLIVLYLYLEYFVINISRPSPRASIGISRDPEIPGSRSFSASRNPGIEVSGSRNPKCSQFHLIFLLKVMFLPSLIATSFMNYNRNHLLQLLLKINLCNCSIAVICIAVMRQEKSYVES